MKAHNSSSQLKFFFRQEVIVLDLHSAFSKGFLCPTRAKTSRHYINTCLVPQLLQQSVCKCDHSKTHRNKVRTSPEQ